MLLEKYSLYLYIALAVILLAIVGYIFYLRSSIKDAKRNIAELSKEIGRVNWVNTELQVNLSIQKKHHDQALEAINASLKRQQEANTEAQALKDKLYREQISIKAKSLGELAENKPGLIEKRVNEATEDVMKAFEEITSTEEVN